MRGELAENTRSCVPLLAEYFGETRPALTVIGVASLSNPDTLVEIEVVARVSPKGVLSVDRIGDVVYGRSS